MAPRHRLYLRVLSLVSPSLIKREKKPRLLVVGVGGAGGNAVNNMIRGGLHGVEFCAMNTDSQALAGSAAAARLRLGGNLTRGLGAGSRIDIGRAAAEESVDDIERILARADMVFITAGMGGGTGTGAAPIIASAARRAGILTVGVVTKPFRFEGIKRARTAEAGIAELQRTVDTLIVIPNQNLVRTSTALTTFVNAFRMADDVLHAGVRGISDLITAPGLVNLDFADVRTVMQDMGGAMMGTGEATDARRALRAAEMAISNPLLETASVRGARGILINFTGGPDMTLFEIEEAAERIRQELDPEANIIFGSAHDARLVGTIRVSVFATGLDGATRPVAPAADRHPAVGFEPPVPADDADSALHEMGAVPYRPAYADDIEAALALPSFEKLQPRRSSSHRVTADPAAIHDTGGLIDRGEEHPSASLRFDPLRPPVATPSPPVRRMVVPVILVILAIAAGAYGLYSDRQGEAAAAPADTGTPQRAALAVSAALPETQRATPAAAIAPGEPPGVPSPAPPSPAPPSAPAANLEYHLQLGALQTEGDARKEWERIRRLKIASLPDVAPSIGRVDSSDRGLPWRLRLGPIPDKKTAVDLCIELQLRSRNCLLIQGP